MRKECDSFLILEVKYALFTRLVIVFGFVSLTLIATCAYQACFVLIFDSSTLLLWVGYLSYLPFLTFGN